MTCKFPFKLMLEQNPDFETLAGSVLAPTVTVLFILRTYLAICIHSRRLTSLNIAFTPTHVHSAHRLLVILTVALCGYWHYPQSAAWRLPLRIASLLFTGRDPPGSAKLTDLGEDMPGLARLEEKGMARLLYSYFKSQICTMNC